MRKVLFSLAMIFLCTTIFGGGVFLLSGCNFNQETSESGGGILDPDNGNSAENPDNGNEDEDDNEISSKDNIDIKVYVLGRTSATNAPTTTSVASFDALLNSSSGLLVSYGTGSLKYTAADGKTVEQANGMVANIATFSYYWWNSLANRFLTVRYEHMDSSYGFYGISTSKDNSNCRQKLDRTDNYYLYGDGKFTSDNYEARDNCRQLLSGSYYLNYRKAYKVTYDKNGGTGLLIPSNKIVYAGIGFNLPPEKPKKSGYIFAGWREASNSTDLWAAGSNFGDQYVNGDKTFTAIWAVSSYRVDINILNPNGVQDYVSGTINTTYSDTNTTYENITDQARSSVAYNSTITISNITPATYMELYSVTCTNGKMSSDGGVYTYTVSMTGDSAGSNGWDDIINVKMRWKSYYVSFDSNGGSVISKRMIRYNGEYGSLPITTRLGYTFAGWFKEQAFTNRVLPNTICTTPAAHTLYAKWIANKYVVSYDSNGGNEVTNDGGNIRYIKDILVGGSTSNGVNHWTELKALGLDGVNYAAKTKGATSQNQNGINTTDFLLNEVLSDNEWSNPGMEGFGTAYQIVDLGKVVFIDRIVVWHYGYDGRSYNNNTLQVSVDGVNWRTVFSTEKSGKYAEDAANGHSVDVTGNQNLFNAWDFKLFFEDSYYSLNNNAKNVDITNDHEYPTVAFESAVGYNWSANGGKGDYVRYKPNLPFGRYQMTYTAWSPSASPSTPTTGINAVNTNGDYLYTITVTTSTPTLYTATFNVDENFGGFVLTWWYGSYTYFKDISLKSIEKTKKFAEYGSSYGEFPTPTRAGDYATFKAWALNNGNLVAPPIQVSTASNHTLVAQWVATMVTTNINIMTAEDGITYKNSTKGIEGEKTEGEIKLVDSIRIKYSTFENGAVNENNDVLITKKSLGNNTSTSINNVMLFSNLTITPSLVGTGFVYMGASFANIPTESPNKPKGEDIFNLSSRGTVNIFFKKVSANVLKYQEAQRVELITNVSVTNPDVKSLKNSVDNQISTRSNQFILDEKGFYCGTDGSVMEIRIGRLPDGFMLTHYQVYLVDADASSFGVVGNCGVDISYTIPLGLVYSPASEGDVVRISFRGAGTFRVKILFPNFTVLANGGLPPVQTDNFGFSENGEGYFQSQNQGKSNSYSLCRVNFTVKKQTKLTFIVSQNSESAYDFGILGNLNQSLNRSLNSDSSYKKSFRNLNTTSTSVVYDVSPGSHFVEIKYIKNGYIDLGEDTFKFKWVLPNIEEGYFYFEDGEYPQSDADKIEMTSASPGVYSGVSVGYDAVENVVTLDGQYSTSGGINYFLKTNSFNVVAGRKVTVKIDYLGGAVTGGGRVIIGFALRDSEGNNLRLSNSEPSLGQYSFEYVNTFEDKVGNVENGHLYFFLWRSLENGGAPTFNKAKFRITLLYDGMSTLLNSSIKPDEKEYSLTYFNGIKNVEIPVYKYKGNEKKYAYVTNGSVSKWFKVEPIRWRVSDHGVSSKDFPSDKTDVVTFNTRDGWEIIGQQVSVTANTTYTLKVNCEAPNFNPLAGYLGLGLMVLKSAPTSSDCTSQRIERYQINQNNDGEIEFSFNTGNTTSIYIILNGGYIEDGGSYTFKFRDFSLTGGQADGFESDVTKWTKYFYGDNIEATKNVSWQNYGAYNTNFTVVSDKVLGFSAVTNQDTKEGWSVTESELYKHTLDYIDNDQSKNKLDLKFYQTDNNIKVPFDKYGAVGQQDKVQSEESTSYMGVRVASVEDIETNLTDLRAKASDMVAFLMGIDSYNFVDYWTRDLGNNLDNGIVVTKSGILKSAWLNQMKGVRFAMTMNEGSRYY